jgi:hypothetical protein
MKWSSAFAFHGDTMSQLPDARDLLVAAEQAASAGDLASADELLSEAARVQEATLGPLHPDLVSTLNNLAVVAEKTGRLGDAETFYRRAVATASASLPADHPMVSASRQNLEDFCRAGGLPIEEPPVTTSSPPDTYSDLERIARDDSGTPAAGRAGDPDSVTGMQAAPRSSELSISRPPRPAASHTLPTTPRTGSSALMWGAIGVLVFVTAALFAMKPWSSREESKETPPAESAAQKAAEPRQLPPTEPPPESAPIKRAQPPPTTSQGGARGTITDKPPVRSPSPGRVVLANAELCRIFSTSGSGAWRCQAAGDSVAPGPIVLYTRVRSQRDGSVIHRWYRGDTLRQSVRLTIRANWTAGYRTYSRQTVDTGDWRVEVRSAGGELLHEQRFAVQ